MYKSRRIVVRNENRSRRGEGSEKWKVKSEEWKVKSEKWAEVSDIGMRFFACVVGAKSASWRSGVCDAIRLCCKFTHVANSRMLQIHAHFKFAHVGGLIAISPYTCVFWTFASIDVNTCKYTCKYTKTSWAWCEYVCARCRGDLQIALMLLRAFLPRIAHIAIHPCGRANCN